jgi:hypothetical protein
MREESDGIEVRGEAKLLHDGATIARIASFVQQSTMKCFLAIVSAVYLLTSSVLAFAPVTTTHRVTSTSSSSLSRGGILSVPYSTTSIIAEDSTRTSLSVFGKRKTEAQKAEDEAKAALYWAGEWVCKDCGYIYNR